MSKGAEQQTDYKALRELGVKHVTKGVGRITEGIMVKGEGSYVRYDDGRHMLDFTCGIGVTNLGHANERVSRAAADQCLELVHAQCSIALNEPYLRLIERLLPVMPHASLDSFFFWNSGSEAVEAAIKMARTLTGRQNVICMQGAYHGRTYGAMALTTSKTIYFQGTGPLMPGVFTTPFPFWHHFNVAPTTSPEVLTEQCLAQLDLLLAQQTAPRDTAAIIVEPVIGEGGYVPAPPAFLQGLRDVCDKHGMLLIVDEVQSGFGRASSAPGRLFAIEESGVRPDILLLAKGLGNGFPISAVVSWRGLTDRLKPGSMGGTYAGNAVSCAAAAKVLEVFKEDNILDNVAARSNQLVNYLNSLKQDPALAPYILDVRGSGLMIGVEFATPTSSFKNDVAIVPGAPPNMASRVAKKCIDKGMLILTTSVYEVIRFIPPLNVSEADLKKGCEIFAEAVREVVKQG
ncbi:acetylornithine aminotransferase [Macrolepiota fuliginosa MF-IS2]|uniref:Acetylornithine aminotransferase n=1 Tax=Macrolepiota fuliginosa MF-IS2 TaxID=1400762 RepID=A0A9P5X9V6_9AGAR|nr:acetylornithine aminotransferase [Macrolepiota fuliginosa MF-IS2]